MRQSCHFTQAAAVITVAVAWRASVADLALSPVCALGPVAPASVAMGPRMSCGHGAWFALRRKTDSTYKPGMERALVLVSDEIAARLRGRCPFCPIQVPKSPKTGHKLIETGALRGFWRFRRVQSRLKIVSKRVAKRYFRSVTSGRVMAIPIWYLLGRLF